ncbi:protein of unknown function [Lishizhenia tianjinensis]|uniref:Bacteriocin-protection, YdeI or OmpD-Associated n=1 Tax=Lishizhenia tianjinensis TaxID=477690 RepID=A0A1I6YQM0_9FLAO|nr:DUF1905 domain-containing protein [Lishizhenia tianjinensis]SFT52710.1 protein of unknown function [Lishizhenia tianjinensis]
MNQGKTLTTHLRRFDGKLWSYVLPFAQEAVQNFITDDRRILLYFNDKDYIHCALMPDGLGDYFVNINKEVRRQFDLEEDIAIQVTLTKDDSKYGMPLPQELEELWKNDVVFYDYFHALTPGKQRNLLHLVNKIKSADKRQEKAIVIYQYLIEAKGKLDFKELHAAFKRGVL